MNSLRSDSISYFVAQIVFANPRLNIDSENPTYSKDLLVRNVFEETWSTSAVIAKRLLPTGRKSVLEDLFEETPLVETTALLTRDPEPEGGAMAFAFWRYTDVTVTTVSDRLTDAKA